MTKPNLAIHIKKVERVAVQLWKEDNKNKIERSDVGEIRDYAHSLTPEPNQKN